MNPPQNERLVLTRIRDSQGLKTWQIDSYSRGYSGDFWVEAKAWGHVVFYWIELPPSDDLDLEYGV